MKIRSATPDDAEAVAATPDVCPRCGAAFHCGVADAQPCACTTVKLDSATLAALREQHDSCLCLRCLVELQRASPTTPQ